MRFFVSRYSSFLSLAAGVTLAACSGGASADKTGATESAATGVEWRLTGLASSTGPALASWARGRVDLFYVGQGTQSLRHVYTNDAQGTATFSAEEDLGGWLTSDPAAVSWGPGRIDIVARGGDSRLYHMYYEGGWSDWELLGPEMWGSPTITSWASGRLDIFYLGKDQALRHMYFQNTWSGEEYLGQYFTSSPSATSWGPGRLDIVVRSTDDTIWHSGYDNNAWFAWDDRGGVNVTSAPAIASRGANSLDVFWFDPYGFSQQTYNWTWSDITASPYPPVPRGSGYRPAVVANRGYPGEFYALRGDNGTIITGRDVYVPDPSPPPPPPPPPPPVCIRASYEFCDAAGRTITGVGCSLETATKDAYDNHAEGGYIAHNGPCSEVCPGNIVHADWRCCQSDPARHAYLGYGCTDDAAKSGAESRDTTCADWTDGQLCP